MHAVACPCIWIGKTSVMAQLIPHPLPFCWHAESVSGTDRLNLSWKRSVKPVCLCVCVMAVMPLVWMSCHTNKFDKMDRIASFLSYWCSLHYCILRWWYCGEKWLKDRLIFSYVCASFLCNSYSHLKLNVLFVTVFHSFCTAPSLCTLHTLSAVTNYKKLLLNITRISYWKKPIN